MVQLIPEAKQTSWQVFNLFMQTVNELKLSEPTVTVLIGQSDISGCYYNLHLLICLGLAGASGEMLVKVVKWFYSEPRMGRICTTGSLVQKKGQLEC